MFPPHAQPTQRARSLTTVSIALAAGIAVGPLGAAAQTFDEPGVRVPVDSVAVTGNIVFQTGPVLGTIGIFAGDTVGYFEVQEAQRRVWATGSFSDVSVTATEGPTGAILTFRVVEHPTIREAQAEGLTIVGADEVWTEIGITPGLSYSPQLLVDARRFIQNRLGERGILFAQVEEELVPLNDGTNAVNWILHVTEGQRVTIAEVMFNGNEAIADADLEEVITNRSEGFLWFRTGPFNQDELEEDLRVRLPDFYAARGYLDFQVIGDSVVMDPSTGKARLEVDLDEGPQYRVASFEVVGNRQFPTESLQALYEPNSGGLLESLGFGGGGELAGEPVFDQSAFDEAAASAQELYGNSGYLYARVTPEVVRTAPSAEGGAPRVALRWVIEEGQPAYVRRINIIGNDYTHDRVIRERILLLPGDLFSQDRLIRSYQAVSGLGFFESPLPFPEIQPDPATGDIDITFEVAEQQTGSVNFGTTVGGATGLSGFVGYDQPNLFGQAKSGSLRWDFGRYQNSFTLQYTDPALLQSRVSGSVSLYNARDRFFSFSTGERRVVGITTRVGVPVRGSLFTRLFFGYSISRTDYDLEGGVTDTSLFGRPSGLQSQLSLGLARSTLDHPLFPTVGSDQRWTTEFNGGILGGDGDFTKHTLEGAWWVPVGQLGGAEPGSAPVRFALGLRARAGMITGNAEAFPFERFWLGGVQFGEPLRGYEETTITPLGYRDRGASGVRDIERLGDTFLVIGAEYALRLSSAISISAFYDAGNVWRHPSEVDPSRLFRGAGLGLQLVTPFGPFGLDYAYGFDKDKPGWQLHFRMSGGQPGL
jgi:outer membrane protein insertion porin family